MGANTFVVTAKNVNAKNAFDVITAEAQREYGTCGYTGTIAEKHAFVVVSTQPMSMVEAREIIKEIFDETSTLGVAKSIGDKYGPAGCIALSKTEWVFFGWAAS